MSILFALAGVATSMLTITTTKVAEASEVMPELLWPAVSSAPFVSGMTTDPHGNLTVGCNYELFEPQTQDVTTYSTTGVILRQIDRAAPVEGQDHNCIASPVVDKNGDLYGRPAWSNYMEAYDGAGALKWTYFMGACGSDPAVGADGNIYFVAAQHLVGLNPNLAPGETEPTSVMDIPLTGCDDSEGISTDTSGIVVSNQTGNILHVSYGGEILPNPGWGTANAEGYRFLSDMTNDDDPVVVSKLNSTGETIWTTVVSEPDVKAPAWPAYIYPTPDGGVVTQVREYRMENGSPVVPTEYVEQLLYLNGTGQKVWSTELRGEDVNKNPFGSLITVDISGNLVIVRNLVNQLSPDTVVPSISIKMVRAATGSVLYSSEIRGNQKESDGALYGYKAFNRAIGPNGLFLYVGTCTNDCYASEASSFKVLAVKVPGLGLDYPRGAILDVTPPPATCDDVIFIAVAGSGQHYDGPRNLSISPEVETAYKSFRKVLTEGKTTRVRVIDYPALPVETINKRLKNLGKYLNGKNTGVRKLRNLVSAVRESCPDQKIVLAGYSQGALVVHEYMIEHYRATVGEDRQAITAAITIADPAQVKNSPVLNFADVTPDTMGICQYTGFVKCFKTEAFGDIPQGYRNRTTTVCKMYDIVCDTQRLVDSTFPVPLAAYREGVLMHTTYEADPDVVLAGKRAARLVNNSW